MNDDKKHLAVQLAIGGIGVAGLLLDGSLSWLFPIGVSAGSLLGRRLVSGAE